MKRAIILIIFLFVIFIITFSFHPNIKKKYIETQLKDANYCNVKEDCISLGHKCSFGCIVLVNKNEEARINRILNNYKFDAPCLLDCSECSVECVNDKCKTVCS